MPFYLVDICLPDHWTSVDRSTVVVEDGVKCLIKRRAKLKNCVGVQRMNQKKKKKKNDLMTFISGQSDC